MSTGKVIARNASVMMVSQLITWTLAIIVAIFLPRYLGAEGIGELSVANSIWLILSVLITFGMDYFLTKMIAREPERTPEFLGTSLTIRIVFGLISLGVVMIYTYVMGFSFRTTVLTYIIGMSYLMGSIGGAISAALSGMERMDVLSSINIITKIIYTVFTLVLVFLKANIYYIAAASLIPALISLVINAFFLSRNYKIRLHFSISNSLVMLNDSKQYLITAIVLIAYQQIDKLFIVQLIDTRTVGWYGTAMNLFGTFMFVPVVIGTVIFPSLSRSYVNDKAMLNVIAQRGLDIMFLIGVPVGFGLLIVSKPLIELLYGADFVQSGPILAVLGIVLIFTYLNTFLGQLLISTDRTGPWNMVMFVAVVITAPLDFILVPWTHQMFGNGALGGAMAFLFTEAGMVIGAVLLMPRNMLLWSNIRTAVLSLICGLLMVAASWWWRDTMLPLSILVGAVTYIGLVFLLRVVPHDDLLVLKDIGMLVVNRLRRLKKAPAGFGN